MKKIEFVKAVASGNDFVIIDNSGIKGSGSKTKLSKLTRELCRRRLSVGADGLLLIEPSKRADFSMRVFNPDGTEVDMCGNGARCVALYARRNKIVGKNKILIETRAGNLAAEVRQDKVKVKMSRPKNLRLKFDLDINGKKQSLNYINTGVPHVVCFAPGLDNFNVKETGRAVRYHSEFQPKGTNVDFVEVLDKGHIRIRTYERGVEGETLACGTGCVAAAIITTYDMQEMPEGKYKINVDTQSGETLGVYFNINKKDIDEVYLEGKAEIIYKGEKYV